MQPENRSELVEVVPIRMWGTDEKETGARQNDFFNPSFYRPAGLTDEPTWYESLFDEPNNGVVSAMLIEENDVLAELLNSHEFHREVHQRVIKAVLKRLAPLAIENWKQRHGKTNDPTPIPKCGWFANPATSTEPANRINLGISMLNHHIPKTQYNPDNPMPTNLVSHLGYYRFKNLDKATGNIVGRIIKAIRGSIASEANDERTG